MNNYQTKAVADLDDFGGKLAHIRARDELGKMSFDADINDAFISREIDKWNGYFLSNFDGIGYLTEDDRNEDRSIRMFVIHCDETFYRQYLVSATVEQEAHNNILAAAC